MPKQKYVIGRFDGYVADYNADEGSCDWVVNVKKAEKFTDMIQAIAAVQTLELPVGGTYIEEYRFSE